MAPSQPTSVVLFTYRVGFGDCLLLRFRYPSGDRHVLLDFGSSAAPANLEGKRLMRRVAEDVREKCGGKLEAVVVTHRHGDHLSGFAGETWNVIRALRPGLVLLPWTEDPAAAPGARTATRRSAPGEAERAHVAALASMQGLADAALLELQAKGDRVELRRAGVTDEDEDEEEPGWTASTRPFSKAVTRQLSFLGEANLANAAAVKNLMKLPREFLAFGARTGLERLLPGVKVRVLGPPTLEQSSAIAEQRVTDPDEFWHLAARSAARSAGLGASPFPRVKPLPLSRQPLEIRWFTKRLDAARGEELLELVRILDGALNNTSLILLFEVGGKKLLFPGDAQIESWSYALSRPEVRALLAEVDVYKVGHHGSLNATPKTLWNLFRKKGQEGGLKTFLSTRPGKHGSPARGTEVPRSKLVAALKSESELHSTASLKRDELCIEEVVAP